MKLTASAVITAVVLLTLAVSAGCQDVGAEPAAAPANPAPATVGRQELPGGVVAEVRGLRIVAPGIGSESPSPVRLSAGRAPGGRVRLGVDDK